MVWIFQLSRALKLFNAHILGNCIHLLTNNLEYWSPFLPMFADVIGRRMIKSSGRPEFANTTISCFIDCTVIAICQPCSTPLVGDDPDILNHYIQMVFYNGWKHHHGIKYLSLEAPNGLRMYLYGPRSYKDSDLGLLRDSEINGKLFHLQSENINQYCAYGDGIFPLRSHIRSQNINSIDPLEHIEKTIMKEFVL